MRLLTLLLFLLPCATLLAQVPEPSSNEPANYYSSINTQTCSGLKTALYSIISQNATVLSYTPGVWNAFARTDIKRNFENTRNIIWDMYSNRGPSLNEPYEYVYSTNQCGNYNSEGDCYNREHSFPASWFNDQSPMYTDLHQLFPTDGYVNNIRGNLPFGETNSPNYTAQNGSKRGASSFSGYSGTVFEPINEYKGDFARVQFYMATRYDNLIASWASNSTSANDVMNATQYPAFESWYIRLLYKWHQQDPVSQKEINRNDSVFLIQGNRNPFVDRPEWVFRVWSCTGLLTPTAVNDIAAASQQLGIYPNPATSAGATIKLQRALLKATTVQVVDMNGRILYQQLLPAGQTILQLQTKQLQPGIYSVRIVNNEVRMVKTLLVQ